MCILSFIIPVYNSALYLNKCLDSLVDKRIIDNIEVIVVDDGSSDRI